VNLALGRGSSAAGVGAQRNALIQAARPHLGGATRVAALDVGWAGAATEATIVDLAGVTDPSVARLAGGHTTKRLPANFLETRRVDALVVLAVAPQRAPLGELRVARGVEARLATLDGAERFTPVAVIPLTGTDQGYVIFRRGASG
jgi:hypothetical protein